MKISQKCTQACGFILTQTTDALMKEQVDHYLVSNSTIQNNLEQADDEQNSVGSAQLQNEQINDGKQIEIINFSNSAFTFQGTDTIEVFCLGKNMFQLLNDNAKAKLALNLEVDFPKTNSGIKFSRDCNFYFYFSGQGEEEHFLKIELQKLSVVKPLLQFLYFLEFSRQWNIQNENLHSHQYYEIIKNSTLAIYSFENPTMAQFHCQNINIEPFVPNDSIYAASPGDMIYLIGSPFGLYSSELFQNSIQYASISNQITLFKEPYYIKNAQANDFVYLIDCSALPTNEGSICFSENSHNPFAMVLPQIKIGNSEDKYYMLASSFQSTIFPHEKHPVIKKDIIPNSITPIGSQLDSKMFNHVCQIQLNDKSSFCTGILLNAKRGFVLTVRHLINDSLTNLNDNFIKDQLFIIQIASNPQINYTAQAICYSSIEVDLLLLKIVDFENNPDFHLQQNPPIQISNSVYQGMEVICVGYGIFTKANPQVARGYVSKCIKRGTYSPVQLIQTSCQAHNGYSGGPLFNTEGHLVGNMLLNVKNDKNEVFCELNFGYSTFYLKEIYEMVNDDNYKEENMSNSGVFQKQDSFLKSITTLFTRLQVPQFHYPLPRL